MGQPIGTWDDELFWAYRKAKPGPRKRDLLGKLLVQNMPLVKVLTDQFVQPSGKCKRGPNLLRGGNDGFTDIPWDDAIQMASIAFMKAMDRFDPTKGKIAWYLKLKIRHELQTLVTSGGRTVRIPRGHESEAVGVELTGEQEVLDRLSGGELDGFASVEDITEEDVARWDAEKSWPESVEAAREELRMRNAPVVPVDMRTALERFLDEEIVFGPPLRVAREPLATRWTRLTGSDYATTLRPALLARKEVREQAVRAPWDRSVVWGLAGLTLQSVA